MLEYRFFGTRVCPDFILTQARENPYSDIFYAVYNKIFRGKCKGHLRFGLKALKLLKYC